jgi:arsenate reductase (thioredoxin)
MSNSTSQNGGRSLYSELQNTLQTAEREFAKIPAERQEELESIAKYIRQKISEHTPARLIFICTHNSRRSHLSQIWAQVAAKYYHLRGIESFSGGTEATAFNPRAVAALQRNGLRIVADDATSPNPRYSVWTSDDDTPFVCFSKTYDAPPNPTQGYCAIMTCSQADDACPLVIGCELRVPIRYEDPKIADDTEEETKRYDERSLQICREMLYLMNRSR